MSDTQLVSVVLAVAATMVTVLTGILVNNARLSDLRAHLDTRFEAMDRRFDEMRDLWRSELRRLEEVVDARIKRVEDRD